MLQRIENISINRMPHLFSKKGHVILHIGKKSRANFSNLRLTKDEYEQFIKQRYATPYCFNVDGISYWLFENKFYKDTDGLKAEDVKALLITRNRLRQEHINRARTIASLVSEPHKTEHRDAIPDDVKILVWERDGGKCRKCGSNIELQYDHVIPYSLGGANTVDNLQILCGKCNRLKSASVA